MEDGREMELVAPLAGNEKTWPKSQSLSRDEMIEMYRLMLT